MTPLNKTTTSAEPARQRRWLRRLIGGLGTLLPWLAVRILYRLWIRAPRFGEPRREQRWREQSRQGGLEHRLGPIAVYRWGPAAAPYVLLVHGWSGRGTQLGAFAQPLVQAGFGVIAFDAPGHGRSPGTSTTIFEINEVFKALVGRYGRPHGIIAHSFGVVVTCYNLNHGVDAGRVVCLSAPSRVLSLVDHFAEMLQLSPALKERFIRYGERRFGSGIWQEIDPERNAAQLRVPALLIHDRDDKDVPCEHSRRLAEVWPGARLHLTEGLGHRRVLRDCAVAQAIVAFMQER